MIAFASTLIPAAFPALALAHFLALLSPGPDFFLILGHAVRHRLRGALYICLGIALGNALYICLAVSGWSIMRQVPSLYRILELAGAGYLAWLGFLLLRALEKRIPFIEGLAGLTLAGIALWLVLRPLFA